MYGYYYPTMPQYQYPVMPQQPPVVPPEAYSQDDVRNDNGANMKQSIIQPEQVNQQQAFYTNLQSVAKIPQPNRYVTTVYPVYLKHLSEHQGKEINVQTTVNEVSGVLEGVAIDHIALKSNKNKTMHIPLGQIVYFENK